jgi:hypothetical protein
VHLALRCEMYEAGVATATVGNRKELLNLNQISVTHRMILGFGPCSPPSTQRSTLVLHMASSWAGQLVVRETKE